MKEKPTLKPSERGIFRMTEFIKRKEMLSGE